LINKSKLADMNTFCYIQEQTSSEEDYTNFGYQVYDKGNRFYVTFKAVLQSFEVKNRNGREYDQNNVWDKIVNDEYIQDQLRKNSWMGEIDHPAPIYKDDELTVQRIANPDPKLTSHYIRSPRLNSNLLEANIQTDSGTEAGMNFAIKIVDGKIIPCFSARVLGSAKTVGGRLVVWVNKLVTYDWVFYPSHKEAEARINQPRMEAVDDFTKFTGCKVIYFPELARMAANNSRETEYLCESFGLTIDDVIGITESGNSIVIQENSNIYAQPIMDSTIKNKTQKMMKDWLHR